MMKADTKYVLDSNAFIESKRKFYAFDICPGYWEALIWHHTQGALGSIDRVAAELERGGDDLWTWAEGKLPTEFFASTDTAEVIACYRRVIAWAQTQNQFYLEAKAEFAEMERADAWLIAYSMATGSVLVTLEKYEPLIRNRVKVPNVCRALGVVCITPFEMLRRLKVRLSWEPRT